MAVNIERTTHKTKHFAPLAAAMRADDRREALAMLGMGGAPALFMSMYCSREMYVATTDGVPLCAFGVCQTNGLNLIWLVASAEIEKHKRELLLGAKEKLDELLARYGRLENLVDVRSRKSLRFIKWLGFTLSPEVIPAGVNGELFYHFYKERGEADCVR